MAVARPAARPPPPRAARLRADRGPARRRQAEPAAPRQRGRVRRRSEPNAPKPAAGGGRSADADALIKQAREAWLRQQCGSAIDLSRKALKAKPGMTDAYQVIAVCSCSLKDADGATRAYAKLDDKSRSLVRRRSA